MQAVNRESVGDGAVSARSAGPNGFSGPRQARERSSAAGVQQRWSRSMRSPRRLPRSGSLRVRAAHVSQARREQQALGVALLHHGFRKWMNTADTDVRGARQRVLRLREHARTTASRSSSACGRRRVAHLRGSRDVSVTFGSGASRSNTKPPRMARSELDRRPAIGRCSAVDAFPLGSREHRVGATRRAAAAWSRGTEACDGEL